MKIIYKYNLEITYDQLIEIPINAEILTVQIQYGELQLWAIVESDSQKEKRHIRIHDTGQGMSNVEKLRYISTFQILNGDFIFHVFEVIK